jgi:hypothetical protein
MSTATELLRRALESFDWMDVDNSVTDDIRAFLAAETEADKCKHRIADARNPVVQSGYVCVDCHALFQAADHQSPRPEPEAEPVAWMFQHEDTGLIDYIDTQQVEWGFEKNNPRWQKIGPVYLHPPQPSPARKPMTEEEISKLFPGMPTEYETGFRDGIDFAEKHHGIGGGDE